MDIKINPNTLEVTRYLTGVQKKQIPYAASKTLNETAYALTKQGGIGELGKQAGEIFKGKKGQPKATPYTKRSFAYTKSTKRNLTAWVFWDERRGDYMKFQVEGGTRLPNKRAIRVTTKHSNRYLNTYGNFKPNAIDKMLSDKKKFFSGIPKGAKSKSRGIYERYGRKTRKGGQRIRMVASWQQEAEYKPLYPFGNIAHSFAFSRSNPRNLVQAFEKNLAKAIATAK